MEGVLTGFKWLMGIPPPAPLPTSLGRRIELGFNRTERFIQSTQNGIVMYKKDVVKSFIEKCEEHRPETYEDIIVQLDIDLSAEDGNIKEFWDRAKSRFSSNPTKYRDAIKMQMNEDEDDFPDECHIALICYTMGFKGYSVYAKFNEECRDVCAGKKEFSSMANKALFFLLRYVMENVAETSTNLPTLKVYRGCDTKFVSKDKKNLLGFGHFTSTSTKEKIGEAFADSNESDSDSTIFVIEDVNVRTRGTKFIKLFDHSEYSKEEEYLLSPFQLYQIEKTETIGKITTVHLNLC
jgi:hypothetical protein